MNFPHKSFKIYSKDVGTFWEDGIEYSLDTESESDEESYIVEVNISFDFLES